MKDIKWEHPLAGANPYFMRFCWQSAIFNTLVEGNMKKYFPLQYAMMKSLTK